MKSGPLVTIYIYILSGNTVSYISRNIHVINKCILLQSVGCDIYEAPLMNMSK